MNPRSTRVALRVSVPAAIAAALVLVGCSTSRSVTPAAISGYWAANDPERNELLLVELRSDLTGRMIGFGGGTVLGSEFDYSIAGQTLQITHRVKGMPTIDAAVVDSEIRLMANGKLLALRRTDDPEYLGYFDAFRE